MASKPVFALDVDGVVLNIVPGALDYVLDKYGIRITENDITDWDWDYALSLPEGVTPEFWKRVWGTPARPYPGAERFVDNLKDQFRVVAISCRPKDWPGLGSDAFDAAMRDFRQLDFDEVILVDSSKEKPKIMKDLGSKIVLEDNPKNAAWCYHQAGADAYLFTRPWNRACITVTDAWVRVWDYEDAWREITE